MASSITLTEKTPLMKTKGAVRNQTSLFLKMRNPGTHEVQAIDSGDTRVRFQPLKSTFLNSLSTSNANIYYGGHMPSEGGTYSGVTSPQETEKLTGGGNKIKQENLKLLAGHMHMSTRASSNTDDSSGSIEYGKRFLPPQWVDIQEEIERHIEEMTHKMTELKKLQQKRLKVNFVDDDDDDSTVAMQRSIDSLTVDITSLVRASEGKLKELMRFQSDDKYDEQIRTNIQIQLATRLKDITFKLRKREKKHYLKVQEIHEDDGLRDSSKVYSTLNKRDRDNFINDDGMTQSDQQLLTMEDNSTVLASQRQRSKEIKTLVTTINDLAVLFKELSVLVVEQGTVLDRIDYNIECAHKDTKQAVVHIENTLKIEKSPRAKGILMCLVISIIVCILMLVLKHV